VLQLAADDGASLPNQFVKTAGVTGSDAAPPADTFEDIQ